MKSLTVLASVVAFSLPLLSNAQATRTWISGVGDDANPGSRTAPCKTFAGAISKTAPGGVIDVLDPGGFGGLTITQPVTIDGDGAEGGVLVEGTPGIVIDVGPTNSVTLRNLSFEGVGSGTSAIQIISAGAVHIENCQINGFLDSGIDDENNVTNGLLFIKNTTIHNCETNGIALAPVVSDTTTVQNVNITGCGDGIDVSTNATALLDNSTVSGNSGAGIQSLGLVRLSASTVTDNGGEGLKFTKPGQIVSYRNNVVGGNNPDGKPSSMATPK